MAWQPHGGVSAGGLTDWIQLLPWGVTDSGAAASREAPGSQPPCISPLQCACQKHIFSSRSQYCIALFLLPLHVFFLSSQECVVSCNVCVVYPLRSFYRKVVQW